MARCLQEAVSTKVTRSAPRSYLTCAWVGVRSKSAASVVCVAPPAAVRSAQVDAAPLWLPGAAASGAASRAREVERSGGARPRHDKAVNFGRRPSSRGATWPLARGRRRTGWVISSRARDGGSLWLRCCQ